MRCAIFILVAVLGVPSALIGGPCHPVTGDRIRASDLARIFPVFSSLDPELTIAYAPVPGASRSFTAARLRRLARRHSLPDSGITGTCFEWPMEVLTAERVLAAVCRGLQVPEAEVELVDFSRIRVPKGKLRFRRSTLSRFSVSRSKAPLLWRGTLDYGNRHSMGVWARIRVWVRKPRVVALRDLPSGRPIQAGDLKQTVTRKIADTEEMAESIDQVVGARPRRTIRAGQPLPISVLRLPNDIERGQLIQVEVISGAARVLFEAKAESGGRRGARIYVRNPVSGKRFVAMVETKGKAVVRAGVSGKGS